MVNYEAQAAIEFEAALDPSESGAYQFEIQEEIVEVGEVIRSLIADIHSGVSIPVISARFHNGLAELSRQVCAEIRRKTGINEVALSGGVWQNMALLERTTRSLRRRWIYRLFAPSGSCERWRDFAWAGNGGCSQVWRIMTEGIHEMMIENQGEYE